MRKIVSLFILLISLFTLISTCYSSQKTIKGKRISLEKVQFIVWKDSCNNIFPNLRLCLVRTQINSKSTWLLVLDDSREFGLMVYYDTNTSNIYAENSVEEEKEIIYKGKAYRAHGKTLYYYIGKAKIKDGELEPTFLEGTQISYEKRMRNFLNPFDYDYLYRLYINIPGILKPAFVTYHAYVDGKLREVLDQEAK